MVPDEVPGILCFDSFFEVTAACERVNQSHLFAVIRRGDCGLPNSLARQLRVPATRLHEIVKERRAITADTAIRLAHYFGGDARSWLNLQAAHDLRHAEIMTATEIREEIKPYNLKS